MCCGISSKEVTTTARKTELETTGAKLKRKKNKNKTIIIEKEKSTGESTSLKGLDRLSQILGFFMWQLIQMPATKQQKRPLSVLRGRWWKQHHLQWPWNDSASQPSGTFHSHPKHQSPWYKFPDSFCIAWRESHSSTDPGVWVTSFCAPASHIQTQVSFLGHFLQHGQLQY